MLSKAALWRFFIARWPERLGMLLGFALIGILAWPAASSSASDSAKSPSV